MSSSETTLPAAKPPILGALPLPAREVEHPVRMGLAILPNDVQQTGAVAAARPARHLDAVAHPRSAHAAAPRRRQARRGDLGLERC